MSIIKPLFFLCVCAHLTTGDSPTVISPVGTIAGTSEDVELNGVTHTIYKFLGIRYGESTAGNNRFKKPVPASPFTTPYQATQFRANCPQIRVSEELYPENQSEDCLFLNIYTPSSGTNHAVMVWIYGGGFNVGSSDIYQGHNLVPFGDVILVVMNYRVGLFGFYTTGDDSAPGNMGLWDQQLALKWVHENIGAFRGDNSRVTVFGESAGAISAIYHALYPPNKGYLQRAISESGSPSLMTDFSHRPLEMARKFAKAVNCDHSDDTSTIVECLRQKSYTELMTTISDNYFFFFPTVDHDFVRIHPSYLPDLARVNPTLPEVEFFRSIDVINGFNKYEGGIYLYYIPIDNVETFMPDREQISELVPALFAFINKLDVSETVKNVVISEYTNWTDADNSILQRQRVLDLAGDITFASTDMQYNRLHANTTGLSANTYVYNFIPVPSTRTIRAPSWMEGANHGEEMGYIFGIDKRLFGDDFTGVPESWEFELQTEMMSYWTNFAKTGNPNTPMPVKVAWPEYTPHTQEAVLLDRTITVQKYFYAKQTVFWLDVLPAIMKYEQSKDGACPAPGGY